MSSAMSLSTGIGDVAFFGMFDGHGGVKAAAWAKDNLAKNVVLVLPLPHHFPPRRKIKGLEMKNRRELNLDPHLYTRPHFPHSPHPSSTPAAVIPYLFPQPQTLNPKLSILNHQHQLPNPQLQTRNPKTESPNLKPQPPTPNI